MDCRDKGVDQRLGAPSVAHYGRGRRWRLWLDEAGRRAAQIDAGEVELMSSEEVDRKALALLQSVPTRRTGPCAERKN
jgi:hypothetical protein